MSKPKILVILGPTTTGKSDLAVKMAGKYNGEIISADSRQVYKGLNIGTGKITKKEMLGVPHHIIDVVSPQKVFSVSEWQKLAKKKIEEIISRNRLPIIVGGTGFYIKSIVDDVLLPEVPPNIPLRKKLAKDRPSQLFEMLKRLDLRRAKNIEKENPVRLIRAIEIAKALGEVPVLDNTRDKNSYEFLQIGLTLPEKELRKRIHDRLVRRLKKGMVEEVKNLHRKGLSWKRMDDLGLEYRYLAKYLKKFPRLSALNPQMSAMATELEVAIWHYTKRQMTWFKRDKRILWFSFNERKNIERKIKGYLAKIS